MLHYEDTINGAIPGKVYTWYAQAIHITFVELHPVVRILYWYIMYGRNPLRMQGTWGGYRYAYTQYYVLVSHILDSAIKPVGYVYVVIAYVYDV